MSGHKLLIRMLGWDIIFQAVWLHKQREKQNWISTVWNISPTFSTFSMRFTLPSRGNADRADHFRLEFTFFTRNTIWFTIRYVTDPRLRSTITLNPNTIAAMNWWMVEGVIMWHRVAWSSQARNSKHQQNNAPQIRQTTYRPNINAKSNIWEQENFII